MKPSKPAITDDERALFRATIKGTRPLTFDKINLPEQKPKTERKPPQISNNKIELQKVEVLENISLLSSEEEMFFMRPGLQTRVIKKLRRREFPIEAELDLHGFTVAQAETLLDDFIKNCIQHAYRCVKIIHGKGSLKNSRPILKNKINYWLRQYSYVLAFCSARLTDGGRGAVYILLKQIKDKYVK